MQLPSPSELKPTNPQDAIESATGTYVDPVDKLTPEQRIVPPIPRAPDKAPFVIRGGGTGGR